MRVIDASALLKYIFREEGYAAINELILEGCIAPELILKECANGLWKRVLKGEITKDLAVKVLVKLIHEEIIKVVPQTEILPNSIEIALRHKITIYDALYIALAMERKSELVTSDERQGAVAKAVGLKLIMV